MDNYNKIFTIIRQTDLLNYDEKNELHLYLINLKQQIKKQQEVIDKVRNNLEKDISEIKNVKMSNKEIVSRLEQTNRILKEVSE